MYIIVILFNSPYTSRVFEEHSYKNYQEGCGVSSILKFSWLIDVCCVKDCVPEA